MKVDNRGRNMGARTITMLLALVMSMAMAMGVAVAQDEDDDYPPPPGETEATFSTQKDAIAPGDIQRLFGEGFHPDCPVMIQVEMPGVAPHTATVSASSDGTWQHEFRVPSEAQDGEANVTIEGCDLETGEVLVLHESFTIDSGLPITGENLSRLTLAAGALLLFGTGIVLVSRRRRRIGATA